MVSFPFDIPTDVLDQSFILTVLRATATVTPSPAVLRTIRFESSPAVHTAALSQTFETPIISFTNSDSVNSAFISFNSSAE